MQPETSTRFLSDGRLTIDKLNRKHYKTPYTGPSVICIPAAKFYSSTSQTHANDMLPMFKGVVKEGRTAITLIVDGGPDWSTASLLNTLFFFRLWRDTDLDMLVVCSYAARYSAYNPIEHLWSPLSKELSGVQFSSKATGDMMLLTISVQFIGLILHMMAMFVILSTSSASMSQHLHTVTTVMFVHSYNAPSVTSRLESLRQSKKKLR